MLDDIKSLDWAWEFEKCVTKLLGFFIGSEIPIDQSRHLLNQSLERRLVAAKLHPYPILVRVALANQLVSSTLWYTVELWPETMADLEDMDREIKKFVWSGQEDSRRP